MVKRCEPKPADSKAHVAGAGKGAVKSINVPFSPEQYAQLEALAKKWRRSKSATIREAIVRGLDAE